MEVEAGADLPLSGLRHDTEWVEILKPLDHLVQLGIQFGIVNKVQFNDNNNAKRVQSLQPESKHG